MAPSKPSPNSLLPLRNDILLVLIALGEERRHGYGIMHAIRTRCAGLSAPHTGALYRTLKRMLGDDLIVECEAPPDEPRTDDRRRYYAVTPFGRTVLAAELGRMRQVIRTAGPVPAAPKRPRLA
jgi:DNA-binding PadR family transcriptional regulator